MAITEMPDEWSFFLNLPDPEESGVIEKSWEIQILSELAYLGQDYRFLEPLKVDVRGSWTRPDFYVEIWVATKVEVPCSRCLDPAGVAIKEKFSYLYGLSSKIDSSERFDGHGDDSFICVDSWGAYLDITSQIWDSFILSLPGKVLCKEDCHGICPVCGVNLNSGSCNCIRKEVDPRFEILKNIEQDDTGK